MKLVQLLAREIEEWPRDTQAFTQDSDGQLVEFETLDIEFSHRQWDCKESGSDGGRLDYFDVCDDHATAIITREMWQAERDRVQLERAIDSCVEGIAAHYECPVHMLKGQPKPQEGDTVSKTGTDTITTFAVFNPLQARDRIREIDAKLADLTLERAERIAELAAEGFALITPPAAQPAEDMSDWRNWKVGDCVVVKDREFADMESWVQDGSVLKIVQPEGYEYDGSLPVLLSDSTKSSWARAHGLKWHSRPSA